MELFDKIPNAIDKVVVYLFSMEWNTLYTYLWDGIQRNIQY